jgi:TP901 family phage tail tape measure protein
MARGGAAANVQSAQMQQNLLNTVNATGKFRASIQNISTTTETFTNALEKNKLSMAESFRFAGAASGKFGQRFSTEMSTIDKVARERVKSVQTQFIKLGRDANGSLRGIAVRPLALDMDNLATRTAIAAQKQQLFNKLVNQGSTNLLNFGKNTQWTGRQLMVGFTIPLGIFGATASKVFMDLEKQAIAFKKVYGDLFTIESEKNKALKDVEDIAKSMTTYGVAIKDTMGLAAEAAAAGFQDAQLMAQTEQATRLGILGQIDSQKALETTIALQSAFQISTEDLADSINFLNAVENQTVLSLDDVTTAIPKVAPVIQQLGGDVKDLAFFLSAMKEGGINASEGANALKSGLASMINPTKQSSEMLAQMGIDINGIVNSNQGDLKQTVVGFAEALDTLDPLNRAKAIEQLFGKFQFARISALFSNVIRDGSQASRVLDLAGTSLEELSSLADSELGIVADATSTKFMAAMENIKFAIAPIGEEFLKLVTPILTFGTEVLTAFNSLDAGMRQFVIGTIGVLGGIAPIAIMVFGLLANGVATSIKAFMFLRNLFLKTGGSSQILGQQTEYMTQQQLEAAAVAASLGQTHSQLTQIFTAEAGAVTALAAAYNSATAAQRAFSGPVMGSTLGRGPKVPGFNKGKMAGYNKGIVMVPGSGNKDTEPAMLTPGEAVIPADMAKKYGSLINAMISGNIPGFRTGRPGESGQIQVPSSQTNFRMPLGEGFELSHFSSAINLTGTELIEHARLMGATNNHISRINEMIARAGGDLEQTFRVLDSSVELLSTELNQGIGAIGSGKTVPRSLVERDLVERGDVARSPLMKYMAIDGVAPDKALANARLITEKVQEQLDLVGDRLVFTAEQIHDITKKAYDAVLLDPSVSETAKTEISNARQRMSSGLVVVDETTTERGSRGNRINATPKTYKSLSTSIRKRADVPSNSFLASSEIPQTLGISQEEFSQTFSGLPEAAKAALFRLRKDIDGFVEEFRRQTATELDRASQSNSPSQRFIRSAANNIVDGVEVGIQQGRDDMVTAGQGLADATESGVKRSHRRASSAGGSPGQMFAPQSQQIVTANPRTNRRASAPTQTIGSSVIPPAHFEKIIAGNQAAADSQQKASVAQAAASQNFSSKVMGLSFGITGLAGVMSIFGGEMAQVSSVIFQVSGALTGLMFAFQALPATMTKGITELFDNRAAAFTQARNSTQVVPVGGGGGVGAKGGVAAGAAKAGGALASLGRGVMAFLGGPFGLAITAFLLLAGFAIPALIDAYQEQKKRLRGLSDVADVASDRVKKFAEALGQEIKISPLGGEQGISFSGANLNPEERKSVGSVVESYGGAEKFQEDFKDDIDRINEAGSRGKEELNRVFTEKASSLAMAGIDEAGIQSLLDALFQFSNIEFTFDVKGAGIFDEKGNFDLDAFKARAKEAARAYTDSYDAEVANYSPNETIDQQAVLNSAGYSSVGDLEKAVEGQKVAVGIAEENALSKGLKPEQDSDFIAQMSELRQLEGYLQEFKFIASEPLEILKIETISNAADQINGLNTLLSEGKISAIEFSDGIGVVAEGILEMDDGAKALQDLLKELGVKDFELIKDPEAQIAALQGATAGLDLTKFSGLSSEDEQVRAQAINEVAQAIRNTVSAREQEAIVNQQIAEMTAANTELESMASDIEQEANAYAYLTANGISAADAIDLIANANIRAAAAAAFAGAETTGFIENINAMLTAKANSPVTVARRSIGSGGRGGGGKSGPEASGLDKILEDMARVVSVQTTMTKGFAASRTALDRMFGGSNSSGLFGGLEQQMRALGGGEDLIKLIAGMPPEEFNKRKKELFTFDGAGNISSFRDSLVSIGEALRKIALGEFQSKQQATVKSFNDQMVAVNRLVGAGASYADAYEIAGDAALAAAIANETNSAAIRQLVRDTKAAEKATKDFAAAQSVAASNNSFVDQQKLLTKLQQNSLGLSNAQIQAVLDDTDLQRLFMDPSIDAKTLQDALNSVASRAALELEIKKLTVDGLESIFDEGFSKAMEAFDAQEKKIELEFDVKTKPFEDAIRDAEEQISDITNGVGGIDDLEADLERISEQEEEINKKYDERAKALSLVKDLNAQMSQQQKTQLTLADALSQGDIAGAARAAQEMRAQQQAKSLELQEKALDKARELELGAIVGNMGQTREQIEQRIKELKAQIREIEEATLEPARRRVELLDREEQKLLASVTVLGRTKLEWETIKNKIDIAKTGSDKYTEAIGAALGVVTDIVEYWDELDGKEVNTVHVVTTTYKTVGTPPSPTVPSAPSGGGSGSDSGIVGKTAAELAEEQRASASAQARARVQRGLNDRAIRGIISARLASKAGATTGGESARSSRIATYLSRITKAQADQILLNNAKGGGALYYNSGGLVSSRVGSPRLGIGKIPSMGTDSVSTMLTPGEFVVSKYGVQKTGIKNMEAINNGTYGGESVYNYGININVRSESDPNQIARTVMGTIKSVDAQRIRGNRLG